MFMVNYGIGLMKMIKSQVSTVVNQVRAQNPGTVLIDNGDNIQGTILTDDLYNKAPLVNEKTHPMITAMNVMKYDAMVLGNHEFNFGLPLIQKFNKKPLFQSCLRIPTIRKMVVVLLKGLPRRNLILIKMGARFKSWDYRLNNSAHSFVGWPSCYFA